MRHGGARPTFSAFWITHALVACSALCAVACGREAGSGAPGADDAVTGAETGGSTLDSPATGSSSADSAGAQDAPGAGGPPLTLPEVTCAERPPSAFAAQCAGCHRLGASSPGAAPDLLAFTGSEATLIQRARQGGSGMPAFDVQTLPDTALREIFAYLQAHKMDGKPAAALLGNAQPLFGSAAEVVPIVFERDDGALITRAAGRVRQRHELEGTFGPFGPFYFEHRTYGFLIEDFTLRGESRIRVSYLPVARPEDKTNFRAFKVYDNGNVFHANTGMDSDTPLPSLRVAGKDPATDYARSIAPYARIQSHEVTVNARTGKPLQEGDLFEFEFGVFIDTTALTANTRNSYYTDTFRYRVGVGGLTPENADTSGKLGPKPSADQGGGTTLAWAYAEPETYFSQLALNVQHEHVQPFVEGRRLFHTDFASGAHSEPGNPVLNEQAKKLGPLFVTTSCVRCHVHNGGGQVLTGSLDEKSSLAFKLYGDAAAGRQLQLQEGSARLLENTASSMSLGDGTTVKLSRPRFDVRSTAGATLPSSARIARRLIGLGLLEAVSEQTLLAQADPKDCDGDGISGRASFVPDPSAKLQRVGRFGWRAEKFSVEHQVADALNEDLGVQTRIFPGTGSELSDPDLARLTTYMRLVGVPPQRDAEDPVVTQGEQLFRSVGCASCHLPALTTGQNHTFVELRGQVIRPYTDLLLHDMGADLADDSGASGDGEDGASATASEWRTAPLWGVGLSRAVQGYVALLHDGRAQSVLEAVLWHGGEARAVRDRFSKLSAMEREALLRFVESL